MESYSESYRKSGVDITAGYAGVKLMAPHVARTRIPGVVSGIGHTQRFRYSNRLYLPWQNNI